MLPGLSNHAFLENRWFVGITWLEWGARLQALPPPQALEGAAPWSSLWKGGPWMPPLRQAPDGCLDSPREGQGHFHIQL